MPDVNDLLERFGRKRHLPVLRQVESAECGLVCLAMVANFWGIQGDLYQYRSRFGVSSRGWNLQTLARRALSVGLTTRALRVELDSVHQLKLPAILHWDFKHFVVLSRISKRSLTVHDPQWGRRRISWEELGRSFTGVAVELWPAADFLPAAATETGKTWRDVIGKPEGFLSVFGRLLAIGLALEIITMVMPLISQWAIDNVATAGDLDLLTLLAFGLTIMLAAQALLTAARGWTVIHFTATFILKWKMAVFSHLNGLPLSFFARRRTGDITSRFDSIERIVGILNDNFVEGLLDSIFGAASLFLMFLYNVELSVVTVLGAAIYLAVRLVRASRIRELTQQDMIADARENSSLIETIRGIRVLKLFSAEPARERAWISAAVDEANADLFLDRASVLFRLLSNTLGSIEQVIVFWLSLREVVAGQMTLGMMVAFYAYRQQFFASASSFTDNLLQLQIVRVHAERVGDIVFSKPEIQNPHVGTDRIGSLQASISVRGVSFRYSEDTPTVLDGLSFDVEEGESVAIVGASGCGKTTLLNLLLGFSFPTSGTVLLGGIPLETLGLDVLRKQVAAVMQDDMLFAGTIATNIAAFDTLIDYDRVAECARLAQIDDEVLAMPMGYGTLVGDAGSSLSGGQRQRICIARALYREPKILVLDEATSHLDIAKERLVNSAIRDLGITRILVAHRLETIASADRVIVLKQGRVTDDSRSTKSVSELLAELRGK